MDIKKVKNQAEKEIKSAENLKELDAIFKRYLGKKGELTQILRSLKNLSEKKRKQQGKQGNEAKKSIAMLLEKKKKELQVVSFDLKEEFDITAPGKKPLVGHLHPLTQLKRKMEEIFQSMGFTIVEGPEVETEWYNFDALNFLIDHPARDVQDTFYIKQENRDNLPSAKKLVMRTHTSTPQIHFMEKNQPPLKIIVPGRVFRREATDTSHEAQFYQIEGLMVGRDITVANLKAVIQESFRKFYGKSVETRFRPSYFPFTEPSFEIDISGLL